MIVMQTCASINKNSGNTKNFEKSKKKLRYFLKWGDGVSVATASIDETTASAWLCGLVSKACSCSSSSLIRDMSCLGKAISRLQ